MKRTLGCGLLLAAATTTTWAGAQTEGEPEAPAEAPSAPPPSPASALVHFEADEDDARLEHSENGRWETVCKPPCDRELPLDGSYRVTSRGMRDTNVFRLSGAPGERVVIQASMVSTAMRGVGAGLTAVGGATMLTGLVLGIAAAFRKLGSLGQEGDDEEGLAYGLLFAGIAGTLTGAALLAAGSSTATAKALPRSTPKSLPPSKSGFVFPLFEARF